MRQARPSTPTWIGIVLAALWSGCASLEHRRDLGQPNVEGIRYYDVSPYLIIVPLPNGALDARVEFLPDPTKLMAVQPQIRGAKLEATLSFENGTLKQSSAVADALAIPKAVLEVAKVVAIGVLDEPQSGSAGRHAAIPGPSVFKLVRDADGVWLLVGGGTKPFVLTTEPFGSAK